MKPTEKQRGPWTHRFLIRFFSTLLTLLLIWLLGFVQGDIERIPGPNYYEIEKNYIGSEMTDLLAQEEKEKHELLAQISAQKEMQELLRNSTVNSQQTMNQLIEMHRHNLEQGVKPTETEQNALAESERIFLENQKKYQEANQVISELSDKQRALDDKIDTLNEQMTEKRKPAQEEYQNLLKMHRFWIAVFQLGVLIPLFLFSSWLVLKYRSSAFTPIFYSMFIASFLRTGWVMHEHFPKQFFKYIAIGAAIVIVLAFLVHLIRMIISPKQDWLLKQYREAYTKHLCPVCSYPIERGLFKYSVWTAKGPNVHSFSPAPETPGEEKPYTCPSCGTALYESCKACSAIRPALLPHCPSCGAEKTMG